MNKRSRNEIIEIVENLGYLFIDEYLEGSYRRVIIENNFGYKADVRLGNITSAKQNIGFMHSSNPYALFNISLWLKNNEKSFYLCNDNTYIKSNQLLDFHCIICTEDFQLIWDNVLQNQGCQYCVGKKVGRYNNFAYVHPELVCEWSKSNNCSPYDFTEFSHKDIVWECKECNHIWSAKISKRSGGRGCPKCADLQRESSIATECKEYFYNNYNAIPEYKLLRNPTTNQWLKCDIYIPDNIFVEIHGEQHNINKKYFYKTDEEFEYRQYLDEIKKQYCQENGLYIEVDLRKIKTTNDAIIYIEQKLQEVLQCT